MQRFQKFLAIIGATSLLVLGINGITEAADNSAMKIGKTNKGTKLTTLKRTKSGEALALTVANPANAPMTTNGTGLVANLNANKVNGSDLQTYRFQDSASSRPGLTAYPITLPSAGTYLVTLQATISSLAGASAATPKQFTCVVYHGSDTVMLEAMTLDVGAGFFPSLSASSVINIPADKLSFHYRCASGTYLAPTGWTVPATGVAPAVTFTRLPNVTEQSVTP